MPITSTFGAMAARGFGLFSAIKQAIDEYFEYVTMLLPGNGTNGAQNNTFLDGSTNNFTITRNGNTTQGTFAPYGANWSNYFDGTGDYLTVPDNAALDLGTGDYTIEGWVYIGTGITDNAGIVAKRDPTAFNPGDFRISYRTGTSKITFADDGVNERGTPAVTTNSWVHFAFVRSSGTLSAYANGVRGDSVANSVNLGNAEVLSIGFNGASATFLGYISNVRIVKGTAVYSGATYTVPTTPLTAITNTSLLTCQSNRFIDNSTNNFTITRNGDVSVQVFSPFSPTASYAAATIGGSGYFDGSGDYLDVANNNTFDTNSTYTLECWFYQPAAGNAMLFNRGGGTGNWNTTNGYQFTLLIVSGVLYWEWNNAGSPATISVTTPTAGAWHHFAVGYDGTTTRAWVDGASIGTSTTGYTMPTTRTTIRIGADQSSSSSNPLTGYISGFRFVKGTDVYGVGNTTITVPTTPPTAISNTSLLLNFTNAGVIDNAMMNDLETVGNAQISTTQSKWGGASLAFDGTDDRLVAASNPWIQFGTGDFTIEFWLYSSNVGTSQKGILQTSSTVGGLQAAYSTGVAIFQGANASGGSLSGGIVINVAGTIVGSNTASITANTWYHIAAVRNSNVTNLYVNGASIGSASTTGNCTGQNIVVGGIYSTSFLLEGYIDDLRITKGYARYTANFTPPAGPFPTR